MGPPGVPRRIPQPPAGGHPFPLALSGRDHLAWRAMKTPSPCHVIIAACLAATGVRAQFPDYPAADLVLGAADFTTVGTGAATGAAP